MAATYTHFYPSDIKTTITLARSLGVRLEVDQDHPDFPERVEIAAAGTPLDAPRDAWTPEWEARRLVAGETILEHCWHVEPSRTFSSLLDAAKWLARRYAKAAGTPLEAE